MKRVVITAAIVALAVLAAGSAAGFLMLRGIANTDYLVRQLEAQFNCRAEISEAKLHPFGSPTRLEVFGVSLAPRDSYVEEGVKPSERPPLQSTVAVDYVLLELRTLPLMARRFVVENLSLERPSVEMRIYEDGTTSFDKLLRPPSTRAGPESETESLRPPESEEAGPKLVKATQLPVAAIQGRLAIEDATILATVEKSNTTVQIHKGIFIMSDVDIDPKALAEHNAANLEFSAWIGVDSFERNTRYLDLSLDGHGAVQPFDPKTAELDPSFSAQVTVRKDSWIDTLPLLDDMEELIMQLEDFGVDLSSVRLRGDFSEDTTASFNATRQDLKMTSDFMIPVDENFLVLEEGSWVNAGQNDHDFYVTFIASERLTRKAEDEVGKFLRAKVGDAAASPVKSALMKSVKQGDFLVLRFNSQGDLGDPHVQAMTPFGDVGDLLKVPDSTMDELTRQADKLLDSLFGK